MGQRNDFGASVEELIEKWCLGTRPSLSDGEVLEYLDSVESHWPERLDQVLTGSSRGLPIMIPIFEIGRQLLICQALCGFDGLLRRIRQGERGALSELKSAASLVDLGYRPELEPHLKGKRLDAVITVEDEPVYFEVVSPGELASVDAIHASLGKIGWSLLNAGIAPADVYLLTEPSDDETASLVRVLQQTTLQEDSLVDVTGLALVKVGSSAINDEEIRSKCAAISEVELMAEVNNFWSRVRVRYPFTDGRAQRIFDHEVKQFSPKYTNILVMDLTLVPDGISGWRPLVRRRLQKSLNTRVSAVLLLEELYYPDNIKKIWAFIPNQYAPRPVPATLRQQLQTLEVNSS